LPHDLVLVTVGTDHHPFDRLVGWVDDWYAARAGRGLRVVVQHGSSAPPAHAEGHPYLARGRLGRLLGEASVVVCHGGPSTIMEARSARKLPVVVPRDPDLGEHVDGHQVAFARHQAAHGRVILAEDRTTLLGAIDSVLARPETGRLDVVDAVPTAAIDDFSRLVDGLTRRRRRRWPPRRAESPRPRVQGSP
jgi:UDP-N-acetylglucosamine transferase subunit ALG13